MTTEQNNGGPAFPLQSIGPDFAPGYAGMTLRDYFAAKAMQALLTTIDEFPDEHWRTGVAVSDAMIKERTRTP